jgi:tetratricopeptide (TPR) repeat protein
VSEGAGPPTDEGPGEAGEGDRHIGRWAAITLAAIVLLGAGLAILQVDASRNESNTARETTRTAAEALRAGVIANAAQGVEDRIDAERDALAFRSPLSGDPEALARAQARLPDISKVERLDGLRHEAQRLTLKQAALTETRVTWNTRSTQYTTVIAVLSVALFFVGFSIVVRGPLSPGFYAAGLVVAGLVVVWAAWIHHLPVPETADAAIERTAQGRVEMQNGHPAEARRAFDDAVGLDGDFAAPYSGRAATAVQLANPDIFATGAVTDRSGASRRALEDAERAVSLSDGRDPIALGLVALGAFYTGDYERAAATADRLLEVNDRAVAALLLKSAAQVAVGDQPDAQASLDRARELLQGIEASTAVRTFVADELTYLEWVAAREPDRAAAAAALQARLVRAETGLALDREIPGRRPARGGVQVTGLRYADGRLQGRIAFRDLPKGTALTALAFSRPTEGGAWVQPAELALFRSVGGDGRDDVSVSVPGECAPTEVQVRIFLDGELVETATAPGVAATC